MEDGVMTLKKWAVWVLGCVVLVSGCSAGTQESSHSGADHSVISDYQLAECAYEYTGTGMEPARSVEIPDRHAIAEGTLEGVLELNDYHINLSLDREHTPCTVHSFQSLAKQRYFDGTSCHRLVDSGIFVLQCGDPSGKGTGDPGYRFDDEISGAETYPAGTLAMANSGPDTNGSQFFMVYKDSPLPPSYTVFGQIDADGIKAITEIAAKGHDSAFGDSGHPNTKVTIKSVTFNN